MSAAASGDGDLSGEDLGFLLRHCRAYAQAKLDRKPLPNGDEEGGRLGLLTRRCGGVFVTYKSRKGHDLRGCIGVFNPEEPVQRAVESRALASLCDHRFAHDPIAAEEFRKEVDITVSVLSSPVPIKDPLTEVKVGVHGIIASKGRCRGTYLPQVATEQGWDVSTFCSHCACSKAGISSKDPLHDPTISWETYTASLACENPEND